MSAKIPPGKAGQDTSGPNYPDTPEGRIACFDRRLMDYVLWAGGPYPEATHRDGGWVWRVPPEPSSRTNSQGWPLDGLNLLAALQESHWPAFLAAIKLPGANQGDLTRLFDQIIAAVDKHCTKTDWQDKADREAAREWLDTTLFPLRRQLIALTVLEISESCGKAQGEERRLTLEKPNGEPTGQPEVIYWLGDQTYRVGQADPVRVHHTYDCLLRAFLGRPVLDLPALVERSGLDRSRICSTLSRLKKINDGLFAAAVCCPGTKGKGGYCIHIVDARPKGKS
jgi:hypothetical protein